MKAPPRPPPVAVLLKKYRDRLPDLIQRRILAAPNGSYLHWDRLRHLTPPKGLSQEEWWLGIKLARSQLYREIPLTDAAGRPFRFATPDLVHEMLHKVDRRAGASLGAPEQIINSETRERYIFNSLVEEAITSSQLEGASTTRQAAADMIRYGRRPRDTSEQMILNNYEAITHIRTLKHEPMTSKRVLELHRILTVDTLDDAAAAGRLQRPIEDRVKVVDNASRRVVHVPPPAEQLPARLQRMCDFANGDGNSGGFIHPALRAIILHFWLGYDHPFVDGNGRTARALFYWSMLSQGYWLFEYVSISRILKEAPAQYARAYLYTETEDNDITYFIVYQLEVILRAMDDLWAYLQKKADQMQAVIGLLKSTDGLNHRQIALLSHAVRHPGKEYSIRSHQVSHNVAYATARADLLDLVEIGFLRARKLGRKSYTFLSPPDLERRLRRFKAAGPKKRAADGKRGSGASIGGR